jgi:hypothetical protein
MKKFNLLNGKKMIDSINTIRYSRKFTSLHIDGHKGLIIIGNGKAHAGNLTVSILHYPVGIYSGSGSELILGDLFLNQGISISCFSKIEIGDETIIGETDIMDPIGTVSMENRRRWNLYSLASIFGLA